MNTGRYIVLALLLLGAAFAVFRIVIRNGYRRRDRLTPLAAILQAMVFPALGLFTWFDRPPDASPSSMNQVSKAVGWVLVIVGAATLVAVMARFGFRRANGLAVGALMHSGHYRLTRNPQVLLMGVVTLGYAMLWPSWHTLGWVALYAAIAHLMVVTEEEHLRRVHGESYARYCAHVPRYLGLPGRGRAAVARR